MDTNTVTGFNMNTKYKLTKEIKVVAGVTLFRIQATCSFGSYVKKGDKGGYIEKESNLSVTGDCWVYDNAMVTGNSRVTDNAKVCHNSWISDNAMISDNSWVTGDTRVTGDSRVTGDCWVYDDA